MTNQNPMPADVLASSVVRDPSEHVEGYDGRAGGTFDADSGVLELVYAPYSDAEMGDPGPLLDDRFDPTTVRFVEVETLLNVLAALDAFSTDDRPSPEWWRTILAEKLDARQL